MAINIHLRGEGGDSLGSAGGDGVIEKVIPPLDDESSPFLRYLDLYGNTVFNPQQARRFASELRVRSSSLSSDSDKQSVEQIVNLAEQCASGIHVYLWFIGD